MKKYTIITIIVIGIILGFVTGIYLYKINKIGLDNTRIDKIGEDSIEDECTEIAYLNDEGLLELKRTNSQEEKVSPNCKLILKIYYQTCEHLIEKSETISEQDVNITQEELAKKFTEWEVQKFTSSEIVLYKEVDKFCNEHYLIKEKDGYIVIYELDENNDEKMLKETDISVEYLAQKDLEEIQRGIKIYTKKELNKMLEDFE